MGRKAATLLLNGMVEGLPKVKEKVMTIQFYSEKIPFFTVLFFVFSLFISLNSFGQGVDFDCPSGVSVNGCCVSETILDNNDQINGCSFGNGATKVEVCHNNSEINPSTNSIAGTTPGAHFIRCDWVGPGQGTDATNTTCDVACEDGNGIDVDCSEFRNLDATGHELDILGQCEVIEGCTSNDECADSNPCTQNICNIQTGECEFDQPASNNTVCRPSAGLCDSAEFCTGNSTECPADNLITASPADQCQFLNDDCNVGICNGIGPDCVAVDNGECSDICQADADCNDDNPCTDDSCINSNSGTVCLNEVAQNPGTIECRPADEGLFGCDIAEFCTDNGTCPVNEFALDGTVCSSDDGDVCTLSECNPVGFCDTSIIPDPPIDLPECSPPPGGDPGDDDDDDDNGPPPGGDPPGDEDDILETDNGEAFQLYCYYDLRERDSFCQVTNIGPANITLHVQVFNVADNCNENNFNDTYTPSDTHTYDLSNILTNNGSPSGVILPDDAYGFVVVTVVDGENQGAVPGNLIGNFRVLDNSGYEYRSNAQGLDFPNQGPINTSNEYTFNFNEEGGVVLSDVVGITLDEITSNEVKATSIVDIFTKFDISVFNNNEVIFSCRDIVFACNDQDAPLLDSLLEESESAVASFEYGINNSFPHSKGGPLLCPGNNITEGFVRLNLIPPFADFDVFAGYVGLNNGNGRGSMDSFWSENFLIPNLPTSE